VYSKNIANEHFILIPIGLIYDLCEWKMENKNKSIATSDQNTGSVIIYES